MRNAEGVMEHRTPGWSTLRFTRFTLNSVDD